MENESIMKGSLIRLFAIGLFILVANVAFAHPGSGIVVDPQGNVYFIDTGAGIWKVDRAGNLTLLGGPKFHWMAIDVNDRLSKVALPHFASQNATITQVGSNPTLLASSDFPITVGGDGSLYYAWAQSSDQVKIFRLAPSRGTTIVKRLPSVRSGSHEMLWRNGLAISADGSIYCSEDKAIRKISPKDELTTVVENLSQPGCDSVPGVEPGMGPYYRGLDIDSSGTVYVAASGCRAVLKITADKKVSTLLRSESPWSPTAVALSGRDLYVLEYFHTINESRSEWIPRVRKVSPDGTVTTVATVTRR